MKTTIHTTFKVLDFILLDICFTALFLATMNFIQTQFPGLGWPGLASIGWNG